MYQNFLNLLMTSKIYKPSEISEVIKIVRPNFVFDRQISKVKYYNIPCAFDIETTSFYNGDEKTAIMYEWSFAIYGVVIIGRTWDELINMCGEISRILDLSENKRIVVYIHNAAFDFQFFRKYFEWVTVFAVNTRKPLYMVSTIGIEFRCSYLLSGYSLEKIGNDLHTYHVKKLIGALDYTKTRHSETPLTEIELEYCANDVKVVSAYIMEKIEDEGGIGSIPHTKTGYVRRFCRNACLYEGGTKAEKNISRLKYRDEIAHLQMSVDEYKQLKRAFQGGFTHGNPFMVGDVQNDVTSMDFTSSYPAVMVMDKFPISSAECVNIKTMSEFYKNLRCYCCLFDVEFTMLESKVVYDSYISSSRCWCRHAPGERENIQINNGRIVRADFIKTTITGEDFMIIRHMYTWGKMRIANFRRYKKGYLPTQFVKAILELYQKKTELKGVEGKEIEYLHYKEMQNSCYGMAVTDPCKPPIDYHDNLWEDEGERKNEPSKYIDFEALCNKYNHDKNRFLFYAWGVWVTAHARKRLFTGIAELQDDYVYSDTDSVKFLNYKAHKKYFELYNDRVRKSLKTAMEYHGLPFELCEPTTIKGVKKCLGAWDFDGEYRRFITNGAKRYMVEYADTGVYSITVSGINKHTAIPYICQGLCSDIRTHKQNFNPFDKFVDGMHIPPEYTGKLIHTYIDSEMEGVIIDYTGRAYKYHELSGVHLEPADYTMGIDGDFIDYCLNIKGE